MFGCFTIALIFIFRSGPRRTEFSLKVKFMLDMIQVLSPILNTHHFGKIKSLRQHHYAADLQTNC